jgi:hypothetical protein
MHTSISAPVTDAGKPTNDAAAAAPDRKSTVVETTNAPTNTPERTAPNTGPPRLPTLAEAQTYWALSRS